MERERRLGAERATDVRDQVFTAEIDLDAAMHREGPVPLPACVLLLLPLLLLPLVTTGGSLPFLLRPLWGPLLLLLMLLLVGQGAFFCYSPPGACCCSCCCCCRCCCWLLLLLCSRLDNQLTLQARLKAAAGAAAAAVEALYMQYSLTSARD